MLGLAGKNDTVSFFRADSEFLPKSPKHATKIFDKRYSNISSRKQSHASRSTMTIPGMVGYPLWFSCAYGPYMRLMLSNQRASLAMHMQGKRPLAM